MDESRIDKFVRLGPHFQCHRKDDPGVLIRTSLLARWGAMIRLWLVSTSITVLAHRLCWTVLYCSVL